MGSLRLTKLLPESFKGKKVMGRDPRKRGGGDWSMISVLIALDRGGTVSHKALERNTKFELHKALTPLISPGSVLCIDGDLTYKSLAKELNIDHKRLIVNDNIRVIDCIYHIQTLNNYMMRWKSWITRFHGGGTAYLEHYLSWFRFMEQHKVHNDQEWVKEAFSYQHLKPTEPIIYSLGHT